MLPKYALILIPLNNDYSDLSGRIYKENNLIEAKEYKNNADIRYGLYGTLWGKTTTNKWLNLDKNATYAVVRIVLNNDIVYLDELENLIKFKSGMVVKISDLNNCAKYISENCPPAIKESLAGLHVQSETEDLVVKGFLSSAISKHDKSHAVNFGDMGVAETLCDVAHAISLGKNGKAISQGMESCSFAAGNNAEIISGKEGVSVGIGIKSIGKAGDNGMLILAYNDGYRKRVKVGYVGENIESNVMYNVNPQGEFEKV